MLIDHSGSGEHLLHLLNLTDGERFALGVTSMHKTQCTTTLHLLNGAHVPGSSTLEKLENILHPGQRWA